LLELAVAGRSNCGKSSLINALTGRAKLARTSSTPGRTQQIIFFHVSLGSEHQPFYLVDLPGYGYARASKGARQAWGELVTSYIDSRETLRALALLNDARRPPADEERDLLAWASDRGLRTLVVLTKADKLKKSERFVAAERAKTALDLPRRPLVFSINDERAVTALREEVAATLLGQVATSGCR
jgi:GTP-binding protein